VTVQTSVYEILSNIKSGLVDCETDSSNSIEVMDGRCFEYFETNEGKHIVISFKSSSSDGLICVINEKHYIPVSFIAAIDGYVGYPIDNAESHIIVSLKPNGDLEFVSSGPYEAYCGTYIEQY